MNIFADIKGYQYRTMSRRQAERLLTRLERGSGGWKVMGTPATEQLFFQNDNPVFAIRAVANPPWREFFWVDNSANIV